MRPSGAYVTASSPVAAREQTMPSFNVTLTLIGGPTVLIELAGLRFLTDPTFDEPGLYEGGVTLEKITSPALSADQVGAVDAVLLSHDTSPGTRSGTKESSKLRDGTSRGWSSSIPASRSRAASFMSRWTPTTRWRRRTPSRRRKLSLFTTKAGGISLKCAEDLAQAFRTLGLADRLLPLERGRAVKLSLEGAPRRSLREIRARGGAVTECRTA
jgi:hypothetical protein